MFRTDGGNQKVDLIIYSTDTGYLERCADDTVSIYSKASSAGTRSVRYIGGDRCQKLCAVFNDETGDLYSSLYTEDKLEKLSDSTSPLSDQNVIQTMRSLCSKYGIQYVSWLETAKADCLFNKGYPVPEGYTADQYAKELISQLKERGSKVLAYEIESGIQDVENSPIIQDY